MSKGMRSKAVFRRSELSLTWQASSGAVSERVSLLELAFSGQQFLFALEKADDFLGYGADPGFVGEIGAHQHPDVADWCGGLDGGRFQHRIAEGEIMGQQGDAEAGAGRGGLGRLAVAAES